MPALDATLQDLFGADSSTLVRAGLVLVIAFVLARLLAALAARMLVRASAQHQMLGRRIAFYAVLGVGVIGALHRLGFDLGTVLGAAGIVTVALGFAAQTSASNFIAGLFLIGERSFELGDIVRIGETTGEVIGIDLLSIKLRTLDNLYVRVPNELVIKSQVHNLTHFPIRRVDLQLSVDLHADLALVRRTLQAVADANPSCLDEPKPLFLIRGFRDVAVDLTFGVWCSRKLRFDVQTQMYGQIKVAFERAGIEQRLPVAAAVVPAVGR